MASKLLFVAHTAFETRTWPGGGKRAAGREEERIRSAVACFARLLAGKGYMKSKETRASIHL